MRRALVLGLVCVLGTGGAIAATLTVPFFLDTAAAGQGFPHANGIMFFIGVKNTTGSAITVTVNYFHSDGTSTNGPGQATFTINPGQGFSFRPVVVDSSVEPAFLGTLRRSTIAAGSATLTWPGGAVTDIQGRGVQIDANSGNAFSFLLPPGV